MAIIVDDVAVVEKSFGRDLFYVDLPNEGASVEYFVVTMMTIKLISLYCK